MLRLPLLSSIPMTSPCKIGVLLARCSSAPLSAPAWCSSILLGSSSRCSPISLSAPLGGTPTLSKYSIIAPIFRRLPGRTMQFHVCSSALSGAFLTLSSSKVSTLAPVCFCPKRRAGKTRVSFTTSKSPACKNFPMSRNMLCSICPFLLSVKSLHESRGMAGLCAM